MGIRTGLKVNSKIVLSESGMETCLETSAPTPFALEVEEGVAVLVEVKVRGNT